MSPRAKPAVLVLLAGSLLLLSPAGGRMAGAAPASGHADRIRTFAERWLGTPYLWGGDSRTGIDCSGYLRQMFRDLFHVEIPRTTRDQIELGVELPLRAREVEQGLEPGDLVFYIDRVGVPNHVVVYMGRGQLTHSVSGRGVVIDPMSQLWGRRVVARRVLVAGSPGAAPPFAGAIPAAGPIVPVEVPCPRSVRAKAVEARRFLAKPLPDLKELGERSLCEFRALADAIRTGSPTGRANAARLDAYAEWLESIEALQGSLLPRREDSEWNP